MIESQLYDFLDVNSKPFTIDVVWKENEAKMTLFRESIYEGSITREGCSKFYNSLDIDWDEYYKNLKDLKNEVYKLKVEDDTLFVFKSVEEGIEVIYVEVQLEKISENDVVEKVVEPLLSAKRKLQKDLLTVKSSEDTLKSDLESITAKFEESVRLKMQMQETLKLKFMRLLNEKKRYINFLKGRGLDEPSRSRRYSSDEED